MQTIQTIIICFTIIGLVAIIAEAITSVAVQKNKIESIYTIHNNEPSIGEITCFADGEDWKEASAPLKTGVVNIPPIKKAMNIGVATMAGIGCDEMIKKEQSKKMIVYIAGPITGVKEYEKKFAATEDNLTAAGFIVLNPTTIPEGLKSHEDYMDICIPMLSKADIVYFLQGWENSNGACREYVQAQQQKKIINYEQEWDTEENR